MIRAALAALALAAQPAVAFAAPLFGEESFSLPNGLEVVVVPNHRAPVVSQFVWYRAGAADEERGRSGAAHFLEHLMFKGTKTLKPKEFSALVAAQGGQENAFTSWDYTAFFQTVAIDRLDLVMKLEADRMANLVITDQELQPEKKVVLEEWGMRIGNQPSALLDEQVEAALYLNHPYRIPVLGWVPEIEALDVAAEKHFYDTWYAPNNAILIVVGDVTVDQIRKLATKYYGPIPRKTVPERIRVAEPERSADTTVRLEHPRVRAPQWSRAFLAPSYRAGEKQHAYALEVLAEILGGGARGRLHRALVLDQQIATQAEAYYDPDRFDLAEFGLYVAPRPGIAMDKVADSVEAILADFLSKGPTDAEVTGAETRLVTQAVYARDSLDAPAQLIGRALTTGRTLAELDAWPERIKAVTKDQVIAAAHAVLDHKPSVTGELLPPKGLDLANAPPPPPLPAPSGDIR